jgi:hypothetical protein
MISFKKFITEKYLSGGRPLLYHWTSLVGLKSILKEGKLGQNKGGVSFTRDSNFKFGDMFRLVFDWNKLKIKGYKNRPYAYPFETYRDSGELLNPVARRIEAEEILKGPIYLKDGLIEIQRTKKAEDELYRYIKSHEENIKGINYNIDQIKANVPFTLELFKKIQPQWIDYDKIKDKIEKFPTWRPVYWNLDSQKKFIEQNENSIKEYQFLLQKTVRFHN